MTTDTLNQTNDSKLLLNSDFKIALGNNKFLLPGGVRFGGRLLRTVGMRPTNGFDEEAIGTTEVAGKMSRVTSVLLARTITSIEEIVDPNAIERIVPTMLLGDRLSLLFMLAKISTGDQIPMEGVCPNRHSFQWSFDIDAMKYDVFPNGAPDTFSAALKDGIKHPKTGDLQTDVVMRPAIGTDEGPLEDAGDTELMKRSRLLELCVINIGSIKPVNPILLKQMSSRDRTILARALNDNNPGPQTLHTVRCSTCGVQSKLRALAGNFFGG